MQANVFEDRDGFEAKPFLRWAGGKTWLVDHVNNCLPNNFNNYHEPFIGGGAVFLSLKTRGRIRHQSFLSDLNDDLINAYSVLKDYRNDLFDLLTHFSNDSECYYRVRASQPSNSIESAAKFIYLNRTSYNGIYRVNRKGEYNVPFGYRTLSVPFEYENMRNVSLVTQQSAFRTSDFFDTIDNINDGDLVFLDPPYTVLHEHNGFIEYNQKIFAWKDQERLKEYITRICEKGAYFILTNAAHHSIDELYRGIGNKQVVNRHSTIGGKGSKRVQCNEFFYTNF